MMMMRGGRRVFLSDDVSKLVRDRVASVAAAMDAPSKAPDPKVAASVPPDVASDLLYEVGWESRHVYVDLRNSEEFGRGRPKGAISVPYDSDFDEKVRDMVNVEPGRLIVGGPKATEAAKRLDEFGYRAVVLEGGFDKWRADGLPIEVDGMLEDDDEDDGDPSKW